jgi:integral membrane protein
MSSPAPTVTRTLGVTPRSFYRIIAIAEVVTWTLLIAGMLLKYVARAGDLWVLIGGSLHGLVFVTYAATAVLVGVNQRWPVKLIAGAVITAIIPYATIPFDRWLEKNDRLEGGWRTIATDDPRDRTWISRLLRWFLNHPALLVAVFVLVVVAIVTILLILGPPGGWGR